MKHRKNKVKRQHGIIKGLKKFLEDEISSRSFVKGVIPGEIKKGRSTGENLIVRYKYSTVSGAKLIATSGSSVQEVFVITGSPERLKKIVEKYSDE